MEYPMMQDQPVSYHYVKPSCKLFRLFLKRQLHSGIWGMAQSLFEVDCNTKTFYYADNTNLKRIKHIVIAVVNRKIVGWSIYFESDHSEIRDSVWAFVEVEQRGKGIGKNMVRRVTKIAGNRNVNCDTSGSKEHFWRKALKCQ